MYFRTSIQSSMNLIGYSNLRLQSIKSIIKHTKPTHSFSYNMIITTFFVFRSDVYRMTLSAYEICHHI